MSVGEQIANVSECSRRVQRQFQPFYKDNAQLSGEVARILWAVQRSRRRKNEQKQLPDSAKDTSFSDSQ